MQMHIHTYVCMIRSDEFFFFFSYNDYMWYMLPVHIRGVIKKKLPLFSNFMSYVYSIVAFFSCYVGTYDCYICTLTLLAIMDCQFVFDS